MADLMADSGPEPDELGASAVAVLWWDDSTHPSGWRVAAVASAWDGTLEEARKRVAEDQPRLRGRRLLATKIGGNASDEGAFVEKAQPVELEPA